MDCQYCRDKLSLYLDGQLTETERVRVEAEIDSCEECAREFEQLSLLVTDLEAIGPAEAPVHLIEDLRAAFQAELAKPAAPTRPFIKNFGPWRSLAACLLLALSFLAVARDLGFFDRELAPTREVAARNSGTETGGNSAASESLADQNADAPAEDFEAAESLNKAEADFSEDKGELEERRLESWSGLLDRIGGDARRRGLDLVESRSETEEFLGGYASGAEAEAKAEAPGGKAAPSRGSGNKKKIVKGESEDAGLQAAKVKGQDPKAPTTALGVSKPEGTYILLGKTALADLKQAASAAGHALQVAKIVALDEHADDSDDLGGIEVQVLLPRSAIPDLTRALEAREGLQLRLFARNPAADSRPSIEKGLGEPVDPKVQILFILPRP